jgi:hypothetical protein
MAAFIVRALPSELMPLNPVELVADEPNSYPCRRCLEDAEVGETMLLVSYNPFLGDSPYSGAGPIFVHARDCDRFPGSDRVPDQLSRRLLSVRAYDGTHMLTGTEVIDGSRLEETVDALFVDGRAEYIHVHNARPGCFAARIDRVDDRSQRHERQAVR